MPHRQTVTLSTSSMRSAGTIFGPEVGIDLAQDPRSAPYRGTYTDSWSGPAHGLRSGGVVSLKIE
ncbi:hypothetical protein [Microvirga pakistanensis]|uniref:hypothetical protein n=1 Tax=Microvirga pakistanensis TaxID=1682650 RepID=UPI00106C645C|nr:hypothetical protein [Microvirga pakistanensis]